LDQNLTLKAVTAINFLPVADQDHFQWYIAKNVKYQYLQHIKLMCKNALRERI